MSSVKKRGVGGKAGKPGRMIMEGGRKNGRIKVREGDGKKDGNEAEGN